MVRGASRAACPVRLPFWQVRAARACTGLPGGAGRTSGEEARLDVGRAGRQLRFALMSVGTIDAATVRGGLKDLQAEKLVISPGNTVSLREDCVRITQELWTLTAWRRCCLLSVVRPRLTEGDRASFPHWARLAETEIRACMTGDTRTPAFTSCRSLRWASSFGCAVLSTARSPRSRSWLWSALSCDLRFRSGGSAWHPPSHPARCGRAWRRTGQRRSHPGRLE